MIGKIQFINFIINTKKILHLQNQNSKKKNNKIVIIKKGYLI